MIQQANPGGAIAVYDNIGDPMSTMKTFGLTVASSGMFGSLTPAQGEILAMECMVQRLPPMQLALRYHIIGNKLSMKADAMLAEFIEQGGKHKVIARTPDKAEVQLSYQGETQNFAFSAEEAKQEPYYYNGKQPEILKALAKGGADLAKLELNPNYATPRKRMQMLWSRVVSDGVRTMMPGVNFGRYTPEELGEDEEAEVVQSPKKGGGKGKGGGSTIDAMVAEGKAGGGTVEAAKHTTAASIPGEIIDAEYKIIPDATTTADPRVSTLLTLEAKIAATSDPRVSSLLTLEAKIAATSDPAAYRDNICKHFGVGALIGLTGEQIGECLARFAEQEASGAATAAEVDDSDTTEEDTSHLSAPCTQVQIEEFKKLIAALITTYTDIGGRIQAELTKLVAREEIKEPRASQLTMHAMAVLLEDLKRGDANLTQFKAKVSEVPF